MLLPVPLALPTRRAPCFNGAVSTGVVKDRVGAVLSMVIVIAETLLRFPAMSVAIALKLYVPSAKLLVVICHAPLASAVA